MRRTIIFLITTVAVIAALGGAAAAGVTGGSGSTVTRARLERSLPIVFANLYVQQSRLLGHPGVTPASLEPRAMCDKHGPDVADVGPGGDWICLMGWNDPENPMPPEGYGKFELNVHSNGCYTAAGPSKLTGFLTVTDTRGREVTNPVFEFDGCFAPSSDTSATGVIYPSVLSVTSTTATPDGQGRLGVQATCGTGSQGCSGSVTATAGGSTLGTVKFRAREESTPTIRFPNPLPAGAKSVTYEFTTASGVGPTDPVTLPVQQ